MVSDLYLHGPVLTADMLREISLSRLEAWRNAEVDHPLFTSGARGKDSRERAGSDEDLTVAELRQRARKVRERREDVAQAFAQVEKLTRPDGSDPEKFYRQVALAYRQYAIETKAPARAIADEAQVPVTTVHRWIREARQRGFLPPGRKGRAG